MDRRGDGEGKGKTTHFSLSIISSIILAFPILAAWSGASPSEIFFSSNRISTIFSSSCFTARTNPVLPWMSWQFTFTPGWFYKQRPDNNIVVSQWGKVFMSTHWAGWLHVSLWELIQCYGGCPGSLHSRPGDSASREAWIVIIVSGSIAIDVFKFGLICFTVRTN